MPFITIVRLFACRNICYYYEYKCMHYPMITVYFQWIFISPSIFLRSLLVDFIIASLQWQWTNYRRRIWFDRLFIIQCVMMFLQVWSCHRTQGRLCSRMWTQPLTDPSTSPTSTATLSSCSRTSSRGTYSHSTGTIAWHIHVMVTDFSEYI